MPQPSVRRRAVFTVLAVLLGCLLVEGLCAGLERTVLDRRRSVPLPSRVSLTGEVEDFGAHAVLQEHAERGWALAADSRQVRQDVTYVTNSLGLRGPEPGLDTAGGVRLLSLGDSSVWGDGVAVEETFTAVAAAELTATWDCQVEGIIGGIPGYDAAQSHALLDGVAPRLQPRWVVIATIWSDLMPQRADADPASEALGYLRSPLRRLATYRVLRTALAPWLTARRIRWVASTEDLPEDARSTEQLARAYIEDLRTIERTASRHGAGSIFLALPAPFDADTAPVPESILAFRAAMQQVATETSSPFVDGAEVVPRNSDPQHLFFDSVHPNSAGHLAIGQALARSMATLPAPCQPRR